MKGWGLLVFLSLFISLAGAQTKIGGTVNSDKKGLPGVSITIKELHSTAILAYAITNEKGAYELSFQHAADSVMITVAGFNLKKQLAVLLNKSQRFNVDVTPEAIKLKEIHVNAPKIRLLDDTLHYVVAGFTDKNDRTIGDVLKKMPGITVKDDGSILYNNKPINRFYIEDKDLLKGRYSIATNNIEAKDVATVQVLENHQPVKALKDREFTDEGAINLKLKDGAKGVLVANAQVGAGLMPALWNNELFSMYFRKGRQQMNTYKGNNTGNDAAGELQSFYAGSNNNRDKSMLSVQSPSPPSISQKRYLFNQAHAVTINNLWAHGKETEISANLSYLHDKQEKNSYARSVYYLPGDNNLTVAETLAATEYIHQLEGTFQMTTNKEKYYLDNALKFTSRWNREEGGVFKSDSVFQHLKKPVFKVSNDFSLVRNFKKVSVKVNSFQGFSSTPQTLNIRPLLYADLFPGHLELNAMRQSIQRNEFSTVNRFSLGLGKGVFKHNYAIGVTANLQQFNSALQGAFAAGDLTEETDSLSNRLRWNKYTAYFHPDYTYARDKLRITVSFPLIYNYLQTHGNAMFTNTSRLFFNPSFNIRYNVNMFWNITASGRSGNSLGELENGFTGYIMPSYRSLVKNDGQLPEQSKQSYNLDLGYRHPLYAIFFSLGGNYYRNKMNLLYSYDYENILSVRKSHLADNITTGYTLYTRVNKRFDKIASTINIDVNYSNARASQISQGQMVDFMNRNFNLRSGISTKLANWASLSYDHQYMHSKNKVRNAGTQFSPIQTHVQSAQLNLFPLKGFTINLNYEHFYNSAINSGSRTLRFADIGAKYKTKKTEFSIGYSNVFNARQYITASYSEISSYYAVYALRPAQVLMKVRFKIK